MITILTLAGCSDSGTGAGDSNNDESDNSNGPATTYSVDVSVSPSEGGSVTPSGTKTYDEGEEIELQVSPDGQYTFSGWTGDVQGGDNPLSLTVDQDYKITANFKKKTYDLTTKREGNGEIKEYLMKQVQGYNSGSVVELTAKPDNGWAFKEWKGDLSSSNSSEQITIDAPKEVTAVFVRTFYLASNGVTVKCPGNEVGDTGVVNGTTYTKRSKSQITTGNAPNTCTSGITDMSSLFKNDTNFDGNISSWDVSSVTDMSSMFSQAAAFNQNLNSWDVSAVTNMNQMFERANAFNGNISDWNVSAVKDMYAMFYNVHDLNQDLSNWDVSSVTDMKSMFRYAYVFNQDIGGWNVSNVTKMDGMFGSATNFNQDLTGWCVDNFSASSPPTDFDSGAGFTDPNNQLPDWGNCPNN